MGIKGIFQRKGKSPKRPFRAFEMELLVQDRKHNQTMEFYRGFRFFARTDFAADLSHMPIVQNPLLCLPLLLARASILQHSMPDYRPSGIPQPSSKPLPRDC